MKKELHNKKGFALLIGVLVASILLTVTYSMFGIVLKQIELTTAGRESQTALYAADSGVECALYYDLNEAEIFAKYTTTDHGESGKITILLETPTEHALPCGSSSPVVTSSKTTYNGLEAIKSTFKTTDLGGTCFDVTVWKYVDKDPTASDVDILKTKIESRGYNKKCPDSTPDPLNFERGLEVYY